MIRAARAAAKENRGIAYEGGRIKAVLQKDAIRREPLY
jgi:hypothetical protein